MNLHVFLEVQLTTNQIVFRWCRGAEQSHHLNLRLANKWRRDKVTPSLIGWAQATHGAIVSWCIYALLGLDELSIYFG